MHQELTWYKLTGMLIDINFTCVPWCGIDLVMQGYLKCVICDFDYRYIS